MNAVENYSARVSVKTLLELVNGKERDVEALRLSLIRAEQELTALRALYHKSDIPESKFSYESLVTHAKAEDPRVGEVLAACRPIKFDFGYLKLECPPIEMQMILLFRKRVEELAEQLTGAPLRLECKEAVQ